MKYLKAYKKLSYQHTVVNIKSLLEFNTYDCLQLYSTGYPLSKLRQTAENIWDRHPFSFRLNICQLEEF